MAAPRDPGTTLDVSGSLTDVAAGSTTVLHSWNIDYVYNNQTPITGHNVLHIVLVPPAHGRLLKDGSPVTQFSQQNVYDGRIAYQHDGSVGSSDSFQMFSVVTEVEGVIKPYTPQFHVVWDTTTTPGSTQAAVYAGILLRGSGVMPHLDNYSANQVPVAGSPGTIRVDFQTFNPNCAVFVSAFSHNVSTVDYPAAMPVTSLSIPGLTLTAIGGPTTLHTQTWDRFNNRWTYNSWTIEVWRAAALSVVPATTMTAVWPGSAGPPRIPFACEAAFVSYYNVADPANPSGGESGAYQYFPTTALPGGLSLTTAANEQFVRPVAYQMTTGDQGPTTGGPGAPGLETGPKGFGRLAGSTGSDNLGSGFSSLWWEFTAYDYSTIPISVSTDTPPDEGETPKLWLLRQPLLHFIGAAS